MRQVREPAVLPLGLPQLSSSPEPEAPPASEGPSLALGHQLIEGFSTNLLVQTLTDEWQAAAQVIGHGGIGVVYTLKHQDRKHPYGAAGVAVCGTRMIAASADILLDRNRYSGKNRAPASIGMDRHWIDAQLQMWNLPWAMGDPGFATSVADVGVILEDAQRLPSQVIVPLAMPYQMLRDDADSLVATVNEQDKPVAVILEHASDPFSEAGVAQGLVHLHSRADVSVLLLRSDTSALGAISHGAAVGAVGAHSGLRHVYPIKDGTGGHPERLAFVVPELLTYVLANRFLTAYAADDSLEMWRCGCWFCHGRELTWIPTDSRPYDVAFQHSVAAVAQLGDRLQTLLADATPVAAWDLMCTTAQAVHDQVSNPSGSPWAPQEFLANWHRANSGQQVS